jgi:hypothetical protein
MRPRLCVQVAAALADPAARVLWAESIANPSGAVRGSHLIHSFAMSIHSFAISIGDADDPHKNTLAKEIVIQTQPERS